MLADVKRPGRLQRLDRGAQGANAANAVAANLAGQRSDIDVAGGEQRGGEAFGRND